MDQTSVFAPIVKSTEQDDGSLLVYGKVTDDGLDLDGQRCDKTWMSEAVPAWFGTGTGVGGNIRAQHRSDSAVGKAIEHEAADDGHYITARIVDRDAILKTKAGVYSGFSVGIKNPKIVKSPTAPNGLVTGGSVVEISLVDRPANPACLITLCKAATPGMEINAADFDEERGLVRCEDVIEKTAAIDAKEPSVPTLAETLAPEALEKLAAAAEPAELPEAAADVEPAEKSADVEAADAPAAPAETPSFDVDAVKALVAASLAKAEGDDMTTFNPVSDEDLATTALSIIARLIQSEAGNMVANPGEDDDIRCLLSAVASLRWYVRRERQEGDVGGVSDAAPYEYAEMAATPDAEKATGIVNVNPDPSPEMVAAVTKAVERDELGDLAPADAVTRTKPVSTDQVEAIAKKAVDTAAADLADSFAKQHTAAKAATPTATKAETVESDGDALVKALSAALEKADSPLRKTFEAIVTASTEAIQSSTEITAKAVDTLTARLVQVEQMAVPGGPALRRTEIERTSARANDLAGQVRHYKSLEAATHDQTLRKGYAATAAQLETELKALSA